MKKLLLPAFILAALSFCLHSCSSDKSLLEEQDPSVRSIDPQTLIFMEKINYYLRQYYSPGYETRADNMAAARVVTASAVAGMLFPTHNPEDAHAALYHSIIQARNQFAITRGITPGEEEDIEIPDLTTRGASLADDCQDMSRIYKTSLDFFDLLNANFYTEWSQSTLEMMIGMQIIQQTEVSVDMTQARRITGSVNQALDYRDPGLSRPVAGAYYYADAWRYMSSVLYEREATMVMMAAMMKSVCAWPFGHQIVRGLEELFESDPSMYQVVPRAEAERAFKVLHVAVEAMEYWFPKFNSPSPEFTATMSSDPLKWSAGTYTLDITTGNDFAWEIVSKPSFVTLNKTSGQGSDRITVTVTRNATTAQRTGNIVFAFPDDLGMTYEYTVTQNAIQPITFNPAETTVNHGGYFEVQVNAEPGEKWEIYQVSSKITLQSLSGTGPKLIKGFVEYPQSQAQPAVVTGSDISIYYSNLTSLRYHHKVNVSTLTLGFRIPYFYPAGYFIDSRAQTVTLEINDAMDRWSLSSYVGNGWTAARHPGYDPTNGYLWRNYLIISVTANTNIWERKLEIPITHTGSGGSWTVSNYEIYQSGYGSIQVGI